jgi:hypothetical protein
MKAVTPVLTRDTPKWELTSGSQEAKPLTTQMMLPKVKLYDWGSQLAVKCAFFQRENVSRTVATHQLIFQYSIFRRRAIFLNKVVSWRFLLVRGDTWTCLCFL